MPTLKLFHYNPPFHVDLIVQVKFFGELYNFVVDTGANKTCISQYLFNKLACGNAHRQSIESIFASIEERKYHGVGGVEVSQRVPIKINFLGKVINAVTIGHFLDDWNNQRFSIEKRNGLLGQDVLAQFDKVLIDNVKKEISFL